MDKAADSGSADMGSIPVRDATKTRGHLRFGILIDSCFLCN